MHSSGSITRKFGPSWKQSTGQTSTQSVYLHLMQFSVTTKGIENLLCSRTSPRNQGEICFLFAKSAATDGRFWANPKSSAGDRIPHFRGSDQGRSHRPRHKLVALPTRF